MPKDSTRDSKQTNAKLNEKNSIKNNSCNNASVTVSGGSTVGQLSNSSGGGDIVQISNNVFHQDQEKSKKRGVTSSNNEHNHLAQSVFIVHGHSNFEKEKVARFIEKINLKAIILHEQPNEGKTIIEKFEEYSKVDFAIVLLTPDDVGASKIKTNNLKPRARQNVIFELGFFIGKLGRNKVCSLYVDSVEIPSDYQGVLYTKMDPEGAWQFTLAKELKSAGFSIDLNKAI